MEDMLRKQYALVLNEIISRIYIHHFGVLKENLYYYFILPIILSLIGIVIGFIIAIKVYMCRIKVT